MPGRQEIISGFPPPPLSPLPPPPPRIGRRSTGQPFVLSLRSRSCCAETSPNLLSVSTTQRAQRPHQISPACQGVTPANNRRDAYDATGQNLAYNPPNPIEAAQFRPSIDRGHLQAMILPAAADRRNAVIPEATAKHPATCVKLA